MKGAIKIVRVEVLDKMFPQVFCKVWFVCVQQWLWIQNTSWERIPEPDYTDEKEVSRSH